MCELKFVFYVFCPYELHIKMHAQTFYICCVPINFFSIYRYFGNVIYSPKCEYFRFTLLLLIFQFLNQQHIELVTFCHIELVSLLTTVFRFLFCVKIAVLSANLSATLQLFSGMSLAKMLNNNGPGILPCRTARIFFLYLIFTAKFL